MPAPLQLPPPSNSSSGVTKKIDLKRLSDKLAQINLSNTDSKISLQHLSCNQSTTTASTTTTTNTRISAFLTAMEDDAECVVDAQEWPTFRDEINNISSSSAAHQLRPLYFIPISNNNNSSSSSSSDRDYWLVRQAHTQSASEPDSSIHARIKELRVAVIGNVDAGKSTLLAVLSRGWLDDGRGGARGACARHGHERATGRTSSVSQELLGFRIDGTCMYSRNDSSRSSGCSSRCDCNSSCSSNSNSSRCNCNSNSNSNNNNCSSCNNCNNCSSYNNNNCKCNTNAASTPTALSHTAKVDWEGWIGRESWKCVSLIDLAGHERYLKTTMFGLTGFCPDMAVFLVAANAGGLVGTSREHLALVSALGLPVVVVVTKVDLAPEPVRAATLAAVIKAIKAAPCRKTPFMIRSVADVAQLIHSGLLGSGSVAPVLEVSNVTGQGIDLLRSLLNLAPVPDAIKHKWKSARDAPLEYQINETYTVPGVGTVVSGVMLAGHVAVGDSVLLGPMSNGSFLSTQIRGIQRKRVRLEHAVAGQGVSFALKRVRRSDVRYGMVLIAAGASHVRVCREFTAQVTILYHSTTITPKYQAMLHCGSIRQTVQIVSMELESTGEDSGGAVACGRSGDRARIRFRFLKNPEMLQCGQKVLFREGRIRGIGRVVQVH